MIGAIDRHRSIVMPGRSRDRGSASTVAGRPPGLRQGCHQRDSWAWRLPSVIVRVNSRAAWGSTQADDHQRVLPIHPHGTLQPDPQIVEPVTATGTDLTGKMTATPICTRA